MKRQAGYRFGILLLIGLLLAGCGRFGRGTPGGTGTPSTVKSNDGKSQVSIPAGWSSLNLNNEAADLQVGNPKIQAYFMVLTESKQDFADKTTYRDHAEMTLKTLKGNLEDAAVVRGPTDLTINGRPAVQYEVSGVYSENKTKVIYLHTTVDGRQSFHQLVAWTIPSRFGENRVRLESVIISFTELP
jgi:hypothetical protein